MRLPALLLAALLAAALSGCTASDDATPQGSAPDAVSGAGSSGTEEPLSAGGEPIPEAEPVAVRSAEPHGEPVRQESAVETEQQADGTWKAWYTVTLTNGVGDFLRASVDFDTSAGSIDAAGVSAGGYGIVATVESRGLTEQMAVDDLARHTVVHEDRAEPDGLVLATWLESTPLLEVPGVPPFVGGIEVDPSTATLSIVAQLPDHIQYDLSLDASSGSLRAAGLRGGRMEFDVSSGSVEVADVAACDVSADASSGAIALTGIVACSIEADASSGSVAVAGSRAASLSVSASSGNIQAEGTFDDVDLDASSGSIAASLTPASSGSYSFDTSSGNIDVGLGRAPGQAYDVEAGVTSGTVAVQLEDGQTVEADEDGTYVHVRSAGYEDAAVQTAVEADATSGSITIQG